MAAANFENFRQNAQIASNFNAEQSFAQRDIHRQHGARLRQTRSPAKNRFPRGKARTKFATPRKT